MESTYLIILIFLQILFLNRIHECWSCAFLTKLAWFVIIPLICIIFFSKIEIFLQKRGLFICASVPFMYFLCHSSKCDLPYNIPPLWSLLVRNELFRDVFFLYGNKYVVEKQWVSEWSRSVVSDSLRPRGLQPTRLLRPWDSPGKNTGVGYHFLLQGIFPTQGSNSGILHWRQML